MNEIEIFNINGIDCYKENIGKIKAKEISNDKNLGYVYAIECGEYVKIGCTKRPYKRICYLKRILENYGRMKIGKVALSKPHTNYFQNEIKLHKKLKKYRLENSELFKISFNTAKKEMENSLDFKYKLKENKNNEQTNNLINLTRYFYNNSLGIRQNIFDNMSDEDIDKGIDMLEKYIDMQEEIKIFFGNFIE